VRLRVLILLVLTSALAGCASKSNSEQVASVAHRYLDGLATGNGSQTCSLLAGEAKQRFASAAAAQHLVGGTAGARACEAGVAFVHKLLGADQIALLRKAKVSVASVSGSSARVRVSTAGHVAEIPLSKTAVGWLITNLSAPPTSAAGATSTIYRVPSGSMAPTFSIGQRVAVTPLKSQPVLESIVIFHPPENAAQEVCGAPRSTGAACSQPERVPASVLFVKRIVAGPGDVVSIIEGHVIRNGKREHDGYVKACVGTFECNFPTPIRIPAGEWFLLGDNRVESDDSRFWGPVPTSWIVGVVGE
jgi:signal peptidase I